MSSINEFYLNLREDGELRCGLRNDEWFREFATKRTSGVSCFAWLSIYIPSEFPLTDGVRADSLAEVLSTAAMHAWNLANQAPDRESLERAVDIVVGNQRKVRLRVSAGGNIGRQTVHENLLYLLDFVQAHADSLLGAIFEHGVGSRRIETSEVR